MDDCIYVGQASNLESRLLEHVRGQSDQSGCIKRWKSSLFRYVLVSGKKDRDDREQKWIDDNNPKCNK